MKNSILFKVFAAIFLAICAGMLAGKEGAIFGVLWVRIFGLIGQLFLNALTLVVVPLVVSSIISGCAKMGKEQEFGKFGFRTFLYFAGTNALAVLVGAFVASWLAPGKMVDRAIFQSMTIEGVATQLQTQVPVDFFTNFEQLLFRLVPSNIISAAAQGQMLGLILFSLLFGFFSSRIETTLSHSITQFWNGCFQIMMQMTHLIMKALPLGVFGLTAKIVALTGFETIKPVFFFFVTVICGLVIFGLGVLPLMLKLIGKVSPIAHFRAMMPALLTAFSTSSTAVTLPVTIECMEKKAGVPNRLCSFILPLGTSINLAGSALYATIAVIFIAQSYGVVLSLPSLMVICLLCFFIGMGMVAGIPSASLIAIIMILQTIGVPAEGVVLLLAVERILDMFRTSVSVLCNSCCASLVYSSEKS